MSKRRPNPTQEQEEEEVVAIRPLATRAIGQTAKGKRRSANIKRKLGLDDSSSDSDNHNNDNDGCGNKAKKKKRQKTNKATSSSSSTGLSKNCKKGGGGRLAAIDEDTIVPLTNSMEQSIPMLPGADLLFRVQKKKNLTISNNKVDGGARSEVHITMDYLQSFKRKLFVTDPLYAFRKNLLLEHVSDSQELLFDTMLGHNVMFHGVGDKSEFLNEFAHSFAGEDVLEIDGRDNPRDYAMHAADSFDGVGAITSSSSSNSSTAGNGGNGGGGGGGGGADAIVKALLRRINSLLGSSYKLAVTSSAAIDVVETAKTLADLLEHHYGQNSFGRYDKVVEDVVVDHLLQKVAQLKHLNNLHHPSDSSSFSMLDIQAQSEQFKIKNERIITKYEETNHTVLAEKMEEKRKAAQSYSRYANAVSRLYIVVHSLDGPGLASPRSQEALSILAACPAITLLGSCDHLNAPLLWTTEISSNFNWLYVNVSTFQSHIKSFSGSSVESYVVRESNSANSTYQNSQLFYKGFTSRQKDVLCELIAAAQKNKQLALNSNSSSSKGNGNGKGNDKKYLWGMLKSELVAKCKSKLIFHYTSELNKILKELAEQSVVHLSPYKADDDRDKSSGEVFISINMTFDEMEQFLKITR